MNQQKFEAFMAAQIAPAAGLIEETPPASILPLHPDPIVRAGIVASLRQHGGFQVLDEESPGGNRLDVVIADYEQALRLASGPFVSARILILTSCGREEDIRRAVKAGIHGYLLLGGPVSELIDAVAALARGMRYLGRSVAQRMADGLNRASLTSREIDVLQLVVAGECNKAIARRLRIEVGTVKSHMNAILGKLHATSRTQAAAIAVTQGLVEDRMPTLHS
jgi:DNA-binding NarL/FixJ family response regulator